jgi:hypothetical protein
MSVELFLSANSLMLSKSEVSTSLLDSEITSKSSFFNESEMDLPIPLLAPKTIALFNMY